MYVDIYALDNEASDIEIGTLAYDGKKVYWVYLDDKESEYILHDPIYVNNEEVYANKEPERFMRNLYKHYKSAYLRATRPLSTDIPINCSIDILYSEWGKHDINKWEKDHEYRLVKAWFNQ